MKVRASIRSLKRRYKDSQIVRRHGKTFVISKSNPRGKVRVG